MTMGNIGVANESQEKERGQARLPDPEILKSTHQFQNRKPFIRDEGLNHERLRVGKAGLPPLFLIHHSTEAVDLLHLTLQSRA